MMNKFAGKAAIVFAAAAITAGGCATVNAAECSKAAYVTAGSGLNVRTAPSSDATVVAGLSYGEKVEVADTTDFNGWTMISLDGAKRYVCSQYLSENALTATTQSTASYQSESYTEDSVICGNWKGTYTGVSFQTLTQRDITLKITGVTASGKIKGVATVDNGNGGSYNFKGTWNKQTGAVSITGTDWISNPYSMVFVDFNGTLNTSANTISGTCFYESNRPFSVAK